MEQVPPSAGLQDSGLTGVVEALIFAAQTPISVGRLVTLIGGVTAVEVQEAIRALNQDYQAHARALQIIPVAHGFQMVTRPEFAPWVKALREASLPSRLTQAALETLSIIAYRQPISRPEIEAVRGVRSEGVLGTLLARKLVRIAGRGQGPGRPLLYGTTQEFLIYFGLERLADLPPLEEVEALVKAGKLEEAQRVRPGEGRPDSLGQP